MAKDVIIRVRLDKETKAQLDKAAEADTRAMSQMALAYIIRGLKEDGFRK